jgi:diguanylate cyclase (GGDEF)-like protein
MKIIVVDDSEAFLTAMGALLRDAGYEDIHLLSSGRELLRYMDQSDSDGKPLQGIDLILMDVKMPELDGIATLRAVKASPRHEDIPVLMISAQEQESLIEAAFEAGAVDYVSKPIKKLDLHARIRSALRLKREMDRRKAREDDLVVLNSHLEHANKELHRLSCTDSLTQVANRRYFEDILNREWNRAKRSGTSLSIIMIDIDHFKEFNDTFGHVAGDKCLAKVSETLSMLVLRSSDVLARYGGEEFVTLLAGADTEGAVALAETMRLQIEQLAIPHAAQVDKKFVTISLGVASLVPQTEAKAWSLLRYADDALYKAKHAGRNRVCLARPSQFC